MRSTLRLLSLCSIATQLGVALLPALVAAEELPDLNRAEEEAAPDPAALVGEATKAFSERRFAAAARLFEAAYKLDPDPTLAFNLARAHEEGGRLPDALRRYRELLTQKPPRQIQAACEKRIGRVEGDLVSQGYDPATVTQRDYRVRGSIIVASEPAGAEVSMDGKVRGMTPLTLERVDAGEHAVRIALDGFQPVQEQVKLTGREAVPFRVTLERRGTRAEFVATAPGTLTIDAPERGMAVRLDGDLYGYTPIEGSRIPPGTYELEVTAKGWEPFATTIEVVSGEPIRVMHRSARIFSEEELAAMVPSVWPERLLWTGAGLGGVGLLAGVVAVAAQSDYSNNRSSVGRADARSTALTSAAVADTFLVLGALTAGAGYFWGRQGGSAPAQAIDDGLVLVPWLGAGGAGVSVSTGF